MRDGHVKAIDTAVVGQRFRTPLVFATLMFDDVIILCNLPFRASSLCLTFLLPFFAALLKIKEILQIYNLS